MPPSPRSPIAPTGPSPSAYGLIPEDDRRPEDEIAAEWQLAAPRVLGALLDAVSSGLRNLPTVKLTRSPRMADFAKWITACEPGLGWDQGSTLEAYEDNRRDVAQNTFEADPVAVAALSKPPQSSPAPMT